MTDFSNVCDILGELYANYKDDSEFSEFIGYNDLGLPLAYFAKGDLCKTTAEGTKYIMETWELFLASLGADDTGFTDLNSLLASVE
jgi:hypothetical protein